MRVRMILSALILFPLSCAIVHSAQTQTAKPTAPSHQQTADAATRKQLAAYMADFKNHPDDATLRQEIIELAKTLKPAPVVPLAARTAFAKAAAQLKDAASADDFKAAAQLFEQVAVQAPWYADAYMNAASAYANAADYDSAKRNLALYMAAVRPGVDTQKTEDLQSDVDQQLALQQEQARQQQTLQQFQQVLQQFHANPNDAARLQIIKLAQAMKTPPAIPEEARVHYVGGKTLSDGAKTPDDLNDAIAEYKSALLTAPWWPEANRDYALTLEAAERFDEAAAYVKLYMATNPDEEHMRAAQDELYKIDARKTKAAKRNAEAQAAADKQKAEAQAATDQQRQEANWKQLAADLANQDMLRALAGPWACTGGNCGNGVALSISNGTLAGTVGIMNNFPGGQQLTQASVNATVKNGAVDGQVTFPAFNMGVCTTPGNTQDISGTLSAEGRNLDLKTAYVRYATQTEGMAIFAHCLSVSAGDTQTLRWGLGSQAPLLIPIHEVAQTSSTGFLHVSQLEAIKLVLTHGGNVNTVNGGNTTALHIAASQGNTAAAALLLENGAQVNAEDVNHDTPLSLAVDSKSIGTVQLLLEHGARPDLKPNIYGLTPFYKAVWEANTDIAALLLKNTTDQTQVSVALYFITDKNLDITRLLLARGANVNITGTYNATPLDVALVRGCGDAYAGIWSKKPQDVKNSPCTSTAVIQTVTLLLEHGAKVDMPENNGVYPLMRAAETGNLNLVKVLIAHGANINVRDAKNHSVLEYAKNARGAQLGFLGYKKSAGDEEVIKFLESQGLKKK